MQQGHYDLEPKAYKRIYLIAGEVSGDRIGAELMKSLKNIYGQEAEFFGVGGKDMESEGLKSLFPNNQISLMGFFEILPHIFKLRKLIKKTYEDIIALRPDIVVTIDSPGFNFRVVKLLRADKPNFKIVHYVAPSVWAHKQNRAAKCAHLYDHMLTLFPFELPYFEKHGLKTTCVGHPIFDYDYDVIDKSAFRRKYNIKDKTKLIAITPGSRKGEIVRHVPILLEVIKRLKKDFNDIAIAIPAPSVEIAEFIKSLIGNTIRILVVSNDQDKLNLYKSADIAFAKSGTNTLEIAACMTPQIVFYKLNILSWWALKAIIKVKFASIINIIANKEIIPELLQSDFKLNNLYKLASKYLKDKNLADRQISEAQKILEIIGFRQKENSSLRAAKVISQLLVNEVEG